MGEVQVWETRCENVMGCGGSEEATQEILLEDESLDLKARKVVLNIDPMDPQLGENIKITARSDHTTVMIMSLVQDTMTSMHEADGLLPVLWEPRLYYQGNPLVGVK